MPTITCREDITSCDLLKATFEEHQTGYTAPCKVRRDATSELHVKMLSLRCTGHKMDVMSHKKREGEGLLDSSFLSLLFLVSAHRWKSNLIWNRKSANNRNFYLASTLKILNKSSSVILTNCLVIFLYKNLCIVYNLCNFIRQ